jgi:SAM-dependent methyltransferase
MSEVADRWAAASTYESFMGRWSRQLAPQFVAWLDIQEHSHWLEIGCGTGALTTVIRSRAHPASLAACDPSEPFIEYARAQLHDERVNFVVAGADDFPLRAGGYDSITSLLALNFFPKPEAAVRRMCSAAAAGGVVSACVWDYAGGMEFLRYFWDGAADVDPAARQFDEGVRFPICAPEKLRELFRRARLADVRCEPIEITTRFASFNDYWRPLLGGTGPAPSFVAALDEGDRDRLRRNLENRLRADADGAIHMRARAWAICGRTKS